MTTIISSSSTSELFSPLKPDANHRGHRLLVELLDNSQDPLVLAVASHDIGQYVKHYERGKKYILLACRCPR